MIALCYFREKSSFSDALKSKNEENESYLSEIEVRSCSVTRMDIYVHSICHVGLRPRNTILALTLLFLRRPLRHISGIPRCIEVYSNDAYEFIEVFQH